MMRILGIDPGSLNTGLGIVDVDPAGHCVHVFHRALGVAQEGEFPQRLRAIFEGVRAVIADFRPNEVAVERVFMARNADSALKLGQARGAAICAAVAAELPVLEYTPMQVKNAVVGRGAADKAQVQHMVAVLLGLRGPIAADAADALAIAIAHAHARGVAERVGIAAPRLLRRRRGR